MSETTPRTEITEERLSVLEAAIERNEVECHGMPSARIALSAVHANEWTLADLRDVIDSLRCARRARREANERAEAAERENDRVLDIYRDRESEIDTLRARLDALTAWAERAKSAMEIRLMAMDVVADYPAADAPVAGPPTAASGATGAEPRLPAVSRVSASGSPADPRSDAPGQGQSAFHAPTFEATMRVSDEALDKWIDTLGNCIEIGGPFGRDLGNEMIGVALDLRDARRALREANDRLEALNSYAGVIGLLRAILDDQYPAAVFTGESGDIGAIMVASARKLVEANERAETHEQQTMDALGVVQELRARLDALTEWAEDARDALTKAFNDIGQHSTVLAWNAGDAHHKRANEGMGEVRHALLVQLVAYPAADAPVAGPPMEPDAHGASPVSAERNEQPAGAGSDFHAPTFEATLDCWDPEAGWWPDSSPDELAASVRKIMRERVQAAMAAQREDR